MYPRLIAIENNPYVMNGIYNIYNFAISTAGLPKGSIVHGYMTIYYGVLFQASGNIFRKLGAKRWHPKQDGPSHSEDVQEERPNEDQCKAAVSSRKTACRLTQGQGGHATNIGLASVLMQYLFS